MTLNKMLTSSVGLMALAAVAACSPAPAGQEIHDPYEQTNRAVHEFNKGLDSAVLRPVGQAAAQVPEGLRIPVSNFAANTALPGYVVNNVLQGDIGGVVTNTMRFLLNTTVGVFGLADPAGALGIEAVETDFGATLAKWGAVEGAYVELPVFGPSTERDAVGRVVDFVLNPLDGLAIDNDFANGAMEAYGTPTTLANLAFARGTYGATIDAMYYESADSYAQLRNFYLQNRRYALGATNQASGFVDPYGESDAAPAAAPGAYINPYEDF